VAQLRGKLIHLIAGAWPDPQARENNRLKERKREFEMGVSVKAKEFVG